LFISIHGYTAKTDIPHLGLQRSFAGISPATVVAA
jgi:hypothetical protein